MNVKKWIAYGATGALGLGVIAGGAAAAASTMDLRTQDGAVVPGGAITERASVLDGKKVQLRQTDSAVTVVSAPSPRSVDSGPSTVSQPSPQSPVSKPSAPSASTPASTDSPVSKPSAPSANTPASTDSPASAPSAGSN